MARNIGVGLARVTIAAPHRRMDVALPEHVPLAELLPGLLQRAGADLADSGQQHEGWVLRRPDASALDPDRTLAAHDVLDGEVLYLVPRRTQWPEPEIDDLVDAIAIESRKQSRAWSYQATRRFGLAAACVFLLALLALLVAIGPPWNAPATFAISIAGVLLVVAVLLSRALSDVGAGTTFATVAIGFAAVGAALLTAGDTGFGDFGAAELLAFCAGVIATSVIADVGVGSGSPYVTGTLVAALFGALGAMLQFLGATPASTAAITASMIVVFAPAIPLLSLRLGKLPAPAPPASAEDLISDDQLPSRSTISVRVMRSDQMLTGLLMGTSVVLAACQVVLVLSRDTAATVLAVLIAGSSLLRSRLYPTVRHRLPQLLAGLGGIVPLGASVLTLDRSMALPALAAGSVVLAAIAAAAGLAYSMRRAQPVLARLGDIAEVIFVVSIVPVACAVLGVYAWIRGLAG